MFRPHRCDMGASDPEASSGDGEEGEAPYRTLQDVGCVTA